MSNNGDIPNPIDPDIKLKPNLAPERIERVVHPQRNQEDEDSAVTKAEKFERHAASDQTVAPPRKG